MKHPVLAYIRGLLIVLEQTKDCERELEAIKEIVEQLKELNRLALDIRQYNKARFQPPR